MITKWIVQDRNNIHIDMNDRHLTWDKKMRSYCDSSGSDTERYYYNCYYCYKGKNKIILIIVSIILILLGVRVRGWGWGRGWGIR